MKDCCKSYIPNSINKQKIYFLLVLFLLFILSGVLSLCFGASNIHINEILEYIKFGQYSQAYGIMHYVRLPRTLGVLICGAALSLSGMLLQSALNNPLASAGIIGVNSGAGLFVLISSVFMPGLFYAKTFMAFLGALFAAIMVISISNLVGESKNNIIMTGIAVGSLMTAGTDTLVTFYPDSLMDKNAFYIGSFAHITMQQIISVLPFAIIGFMGSIILSTRLNILMLGDEIASSLGLSVKICRISTIICAALLSASAICIGGLIGFVGLIAPHISRSLIGADHKYLVFFTALSGGILTAVCDILARILFKPFEIPVGILLSLLGAPFFLFLLLRKKEGIDYD